MTVHWQAALPNPIAFVFSAGADSGAVQVGMLQALVEVGLKPDIIVGCSVGALNGAVIAYGGMAKGVESVTAVKEIHQKDKTMELKSENEANNKGNQLIYVIGCLGVGVLCAFTMVVAGFLVGTREFVSFGIASDMTEYIEFVERAEVDSTLRNDVLDRLYLLRDRARDGDHVGFWIWLDYDASILSYIESGPITESDLIALQRELDSIERELDGN